MKNRIAVLLLAVGASLGLASKVATNALARPLDDKVKTGDKMEKMKDSKMAGGKMSKKSVKNEKGKTDGNRMQHNKMAEKK